MTAKTPAVFLDRDNTLIENDGDLGDPQQVRLIRGAASAVASLKGLGYRVVVITNQGGVARGKYTEADVDRVHQKLEALIHQITGVGVDRFYYCPYHPQGTVQQYTREHPWRKPAPGMILQAAKDMGLDLARSWTIGDQMRDAEAGAAAGTRTILLTPHAEQAPPLTARDIEQRQGVPHFKARSLVEAVRIIAQQRKPEASEQLRDSVPRPRPPQTPASPPQSASAQATSSPGHSQPAAPPPSNAAAVAPGPAALRAAVPEEKDTQNTPSPPPPPPAPLTPQPIPPVVIQHRQPRPVNPVNGNVIHQPTKAPAKPGQAGASPPPPPAQPPSPPQSPPQSAPSQSSQSPPPPPPISVSSETTLRQILQELRNHRGSDTDFAYFKMVAIVLQMVAGVCLVGGLWLGRGDLNEFVRWLGAGILVQLFAIAALLFHR